MKFSVYNLNTGAVSRHDSTVELGPALAGLERDERIRTVAHRLHETEGARHPVTLTVEHPPRAGHKTRDPLVVVASPLLIQATVPGGPARGYEWEEMPPEWIGLLFVRECHPEAMRLELAHALAEKCGTRTLHPEAVKPDTPGILLCPVPANFTETGTHALARLALVKLAAAILHN